MSATIYCPDDTYCSKVAQPGTVIQLQANANPQYVTALTVYPKLFNFAIEPQTLSSPIPLLKIAVGAPFVESEYTLTANIEPIVFYGKNFFYSSFALARVDQLLPFEAHNTIKNTAPIGGGYIYIYYYEPIIAAPIKDVINFLQLFMVLNVPTTVCYNRFTDTYKDSFATLDGTGIQAKSCNLNPVPEPVVRKKKLSGGEIAAISISVILAVALILGLSIGLTRRK